MENVLVADLMTRDPVVVKPKTNLLECAKKMVRKRVGSLLLVEGKKLAGIISQKDVLWAIVKKSKDDLSGIKAIDISPRKIATIKPQATMKEALSKMKKYKFERLPVINSGILEGIITARDILNFHPEAYRELEEFAQIREEARKLRNLKKAKPREGVCEECGNFDILSRVYGSLLCENCRSGI